MWKTVVLVSTTPAHLHCYFEGKAQFGLLIESPFKATGCFFPVRMYRSVCQALIGAVGVCGESLGCREDCIFLWTFNLPRSISDNKKRNASLESLYVFCFVVFVSLSDTFPRSLNPHWVSWMGSQFKTVMWSTKEVPCTFPGNGNLWIFIVFVLVISMQVGPYVQYISITCPH